MDEVKQSICKGCSAPIVWAKLEGSGKSIPLDLRPPVYRNTGAKSGNAPIVVRLQGAGVNHFITCPDANQFAKSVWKDGIERIASLWHGEMNRLSKLHTKRLDDDPSPADLMALSVFAEAVQSVVDSMPKPKGKKR